MFLLSASIVLLGSSLPSARLASQPVNPLEQVRINTETIIGQEGFFRVGQSMEGRWWFIDPNDKPFLYKGVTSVGRGRGITPGTEPSNPYGEILKKKYGDDLARFQEATFERLRSWNFNALGAWTTEDFWDREMPYTVLLDFVQVKSAIRSNGVNLPDVFDPEWVEEIDAKAKELVAPLRDSKLLIGYFTDNELGWAHAETVDRKVNPELLLTTEARPSLLQLLLSLDSRRPAYVAAWDFVLKRHAKSLEQLSKDWQIPIDSKETIKQLTQEKQAIVSKAYLVDQRIFQEEFARRYFELSAAAIRRYDQNHLLLGCRFGAPPSKAVFSAVKRPWVDVVSANNYLYEMYDRMDIYYQATKLPVLNTEFSWGHEVFSDKPLPDEPEGGFPQTERMVRNGEQTLKKALTHPALVGYTWYRWIDKQTNKPPYIPPISLGLVTLEDQPNRWHTDLLTKLNAKAEAIAVSADSKL